MLFYSSLSKLPFFPLLTIFQSSQFGREHCLLKHLDQTFELRVVQSTCLWPPPIKHKSLHYKFKGKKNLKYITVIFCFLLHIQYLSVNLGITVYEYHRVIIPQERYHQAIYILNPMERITNITHLPHSQSYEVEQMIILYFKAQLWPVEENATVGPLVGNQAQSWKCSQVVCQLSNVFATSYVSTCIHMYPHVYCGDDD